MTNQLYQIYHVARCGSTLLTALLSNCEKTFSEPACTQSLFNTNSCPADVTEYFGSIVKLQSIATRIGFKPPGPKVFLYRPLSQYLQKMSEAEVGWIDNRKNLYGRYFPTIQGTELIIEPETIMQLHTIFWASCVLEMQKFDDVLWIRSNDFFLNKESIAKQVLSHFSIEGTPDARFASINVKNLKLNNTGKIQPFEFYNNDSVEIASDTQGILDTSLSLENTQIVKTVNWAKENILIDASFYY